MCIIKPRFANVTYPYTSAVIQTIKLWCRSSAMIDLSPCKTLHKAERPALRCARTLYARCYSAALRCGFMPNHARIFECILCE